jgi:uncharacterized protein (DUF488 family)
MAYTIGYGGFPPERLLRALRERRVEVVVDVRRYPRSRIAAYSRESLKEALAREGIEYVWLGELGALGVRGPRAGCTGSRTFDSYVWRLYHYAPAILQLVELRDLASRRTVALLCREESWRYCHRQFLADFLTGEGIRVIHIRRGGEEAHERTPCFGAYELPPADLVRRAYAELRRACGGATLYIPGWSLEGKEGGIDVIAYGSVSDVPRGYNVHAAPAPSEDLFHYFATQWGVLLCGRPYVIDFERALEGEIAAAGELARAAGASDPAAACRVARRLALAAAALLCGPREAHTWRRAAGCLRGRGLEVPGVAATAEGLAECKSALEKLAALLAAPARRAVREPPAP